MTKQLDGVFEGGGVRGIGLVGALSVIEEAGYEFVNLAGTSAGAIVSTLIAAGYKAAEIRAIIDGIDFKRMTDDAGFGRVPSSASGSSSCSTTACTGAITCSTWCGSCF